MKPPKKVTLPIDQFEMAHEFQVKGKQHSFSKVRKGKTPKTKEPFKIDS